MVNRAIARVYATSIRDEADCERPYTDAEKDRLIDAIPGLIAEIQRLECTRKCPTCGGSGFIESSSKASDE